MQGNESFQEFSLKQQPSNLPFNVETDLNEFTKIFMTRENDPFKIVHCFERPLLWIIKFLEKCQIKAKNYYLQ